MLIGGGVLEDGGGVDAGLGGERALAHIGRVAVRRPVQHLVQHAGGVGEVRQLGTAHAQRKPLRVIRLQQQGRDDRAEIGIAAPLAQPVQCALDLAGAGTHGGQRVGDRLLGIVMGVDAHMRARHDAGHIADNGLDLMGQRAALVSHSTTQRAPAS